ncbi:MAG TPA: methylated-DNA--[protein]-cysteine S-methyltransferase [Usitatibacter sp.]|jgi:methylated-DNA-[protein]-cysteine S-methyltransferase|nr:methylated-DNA--[protein]-cysteine S-methyltransferase [Usitatibacter sp.]
MTRHLRFHTPLGPVFAIAIAGTVTGLYFEGGRHAPPIDPSWIEDPRDAPLVECERQLLEYLQGERTRFELVVAAAGTPFQRRIWDEIARIPYGEVLTYAELARRAGAPGCARAAGAATGRNPLSIIVPCHRVVGTGGALTGYAGGLERKSRLLALEGALRAAA